MSVSIQSETSKDEIETEDTELEDLVWNLMARTGLLPQIQGQISKFIEDNGKAENVHIISERADKKILGLIFEYLQWVGMKQTNSVLLSEAPIDIDLSFAKSYSSGDSNYKPELCRLFEDQNETEDRITPSRSHNYSRDEFEDSRLTSASALQSARSENDVANEASDNADNEEVVDRNGPTKHISLGESTAGGNVDSVKEEAEEKVPDRPKSPLAARPLSGGDASSDLLISFDSPNTTPLTGRSFDLNRPNVTVRQRFDLSDPFQSPVGRQEDKFPRNFSIPFVTGDSNEGFVNAANLFKEEVVAGAESRATASAESLEKSKESKSPEDISTKDNKNQNAGQVDSAIVAPTKITKDASQTSPDDESTSDFMETLTIEEDTQDVSIPSNEQGMSSCEHVVNFKPD